MINVREDLQDFSGLTGYPVHLVNPVILSKTILKKQRRTAYVILFRDDCAWRESNCAIRE